MSTGYIQLPLTGGGSGGITSINGDSTPAQLIVAGSGISVGSSGGTVTITNTGAAGDSFTIMQPDSGTSPTATSTSDTLSFHNSDGYLSTSGSALTKTLTFNASSALLSLISGKQTAGDYITALTGDASAAGPGSAALTLATVNASPGSYTYASLTVNAKGLVTSASSGTAPVTSLAAVGASPNANAGTISGSALNLQPASGSFPGVVTTAAQTLAGAKTFSTSILFGLYHVEPLEVNAGNSGASITVDMSTGNIILVTLNAVTPAITLSSPQPGAAYILKLAQDSTGSRIPTFSTTIDWGTLGAPILTTTPNKVDYLQLTYSAGGWRGMSYALGYSA